MAHKIRPLIGILFLTAIILAGWTVEGFPEQEPKQPEGPGNVQAPAIQPPPAPLRKQRVGLELVMDLGVTPLIHTGPCPAFFTFIGHIQSNKAVTVYYRFIRSDNTRTQPKMLTFEKPGRQEVSDIWEVGDAATRSGIKGWAVLQVISPIRIQSSLAYFSGTCTARESPGAGEPPGGVSLQVKGMEKQPAECVSFNPETTTLGQIQGQWNVVDGTRRLFSFGIDKIEAENTLSIIKHYKMDESCFVGRPPFFHYMLAAGSSPVGPFKGEDCRSFNPDTTGVREINGSWKVADGDRVLFDFGPNRAEAEESLATIKKYGFTHLCMMAKGRVDFVYLRR